MFPMAKRSSQQSEIMENENGEEDCCEGEVVNEDARKKKMIIRVVYGQGLRTASSGCSSSSSSSSSSCSASSLFCCQADECGVGLRMAKKYHQRHKVCERHSKAAVVLVCGIRQRFCQQCSKYVSIYFRFCLFYFWVEMFLCKVVANLVFHFLCEFCI